MPTGKGYGLPRVRIVDLDERPLGVAGNPLVVVDAGGAGERSVGFSFGNEYSTLSGSEELLYSESVNFDALVVSIAILRASLTALTRQILGAGTYFIRVGGTAGLPDGTIFATLVTTHNAGYISTPDAAIGPPLPRPIGPQIVKITGASSGPGVLAFIEAVEVAFF